MSTEAQPDDATGVRRRYDATRRRAAAALRRDRTVSEATRLFLTQGWSATTIAQVAAAAEVSPELIQRTFGGKIGLFMAAYRGATYGAGDLETTLADMALDSDDLGTRVAAFARWSTRLLDRTADFAPLLTQAADQDDAAARVLLGATETRYSVTETVLARLLLAEPPGALVDEVYALNDPRVFCTLVRDRGWTTSAYAAWLTRSVLAAVAAVGVG